MGDGSGKREDGRNSKFQIPKLPAEGGLHLEGLLDFWMESRSREEAGRWKMEDGRNSKKEIPNSKLRIPKTKFQTCTPKEGCISMDCSIFGWDPEAGRWEMEAGSGEMGEIPKKKFQTPNSKLGLIPKSRNEH